MSSQMRAQAELSAKLRRLRTNAGMSTRELASASGLSQSRVTRIENARVLPHQEDVLALGGALHLSPALVKSFLVAAAMLASDSERAHARAYRKPVPSTGPVDEIDASSRCIKAIHVGHLPRTVQTPNYMRAVYNDQRSIPQSEQEFVAQRVAMQARDLVTLAERQMLLSLDALYRPNLPTRSWLELLYGFKARLSLGRFELGIVHPIDLHDDESGMSVATFDDDLVLSESSDRWEHRFDKLAARRAANRFDGLALAADWDGAAMKHVGEAIHYFERHLNVSA